MELIVLVGLPGSGKTTLAIKEYPNYVHINQDLLGTRNKCIHETINALSQGKSVIIDRTNINIKQRKYWTKLAEAFNIEYMAIVMTASKEECIKRILNRKNHPTIKETMDDKKKYEIVEQFSKSYEAPTFAEGFKQIRYIM